MSDGPDVFPDRFPPDAPVVPNDSWPGVPNPSPYCGRLGRLWRRDHLWMRPTPALPRYVCARCRVVTYIKPSPRW